MAGYSNAIVVVVALMVFPSMVLAQSSYEVGGDASWGKLHFDYQAWADSITFLVGDSLDFDYDPTSIDVIVAASADLYDQCSLQGNLGDYSDGNTVLTLSTVGTYYFFDSRFCNDNMKFFVVAH
ncbi:hypothetical protein M0R45_034641 [Rubus argutus]|uniref:Phytocyanin domain-containing protein n=1 Tax=Rubus argutus TaxID=59490 RepID=A0AAW1VQR7_RUBAR